MLLSHDGEDLTPEAHAACPGRGVFFRSWDLASPVHYCADPATYGHTFRYAALPAPRPRRHGIPDPAGPPPAEEPPDPSRRIVIEGNKAWAAAAEVRRRWLATLFARRTAPRELAQFIAGQLLTMPEPVRSGLARAPGQIAVHPAHRARGSGLARDLRHCPGGPAAADDVRPDRHRVRVTR